jgi:hypothetical protein
LYRAILDRLNGIDDLRTAVLENGNFGEAQQMARRFSDDLRLVCDDLGWGDGPEGPIELRTPPDVLVESSGARERKPRLWSPKKNWRYRNS